MPLLVVRDLQHVYISMTQSEPLSVNISAGICLWIKGDNGSGKSTFLKLIAGVLPVDIGHLTVSGPFSYLGAELGMKMHATLADHQRFTKALGVECESSLPKNRELDNFSSGQKLWIRLASALRPDRPLWLLDEPTRFLDAKHETLLWGRVKQHCASGGSVVVASHTPVASWIADCQILALA
ncbi:MAG: ABC transporter ATP-binding protein [Pseudomonadota bacterium]